MPGDDLTPSESAILIVLMSEAREISNKDLKERYGVDIRKDYRDKLNRLGFVQSEKSGRTYVHQLADEGWIRVQQDLNFESPRARVLGGALAALHANLRDRIMARSGYGTFGELFALTDLRAPDSPGDPTPALRARVRHAYAALVTESGEWISLTSLRAFFRDVDSAELDEALRQLEQEPDVRIAPESNRSGLTPDDVAAALRIGGQDKHLLAIGV